MKQKFILTALIAASILLFSSCKKDDDVTTIPKHDENTITAVGTPEGTASTKTIGSNGGEITSEDGRIKIIVPAGAVDADEQFSIQPISNKLPEGVGKAYRLAPHGKQFAVPVRIIFTYTEEDLTNTIPEGLDIAFQDSKGTWQSMTNTVVDKPNKKLSVTTTHFSDWTYFKSIKLTPMQAAVEQEGNVELKVTTTFPFVDPDDAPPGTTTVPVYTTPRELRPDEIKGWTYQGEGVLISRAAQGFYSAPDHIPAANPEAVVVNIQMHRKGQFMLVSNITVLGNKGVKYLEVDEDYVKNGNMGKPVLYMYGSFGADPGANKRSVKIDSNPVEIVVWSPTIIVCRIDREISGAIEISANDHVVANSVLQKFKGKFLYTRYHGGVLNSGNPDALKETTEFRLVYRGFGAACPADLDPLFQFEKGLANGTEAVFTFSGSASVTTPGPCAVTSSVTVPESSGLQPVNPLSINSAFSRFKCYVTDIDGGIEVKFDYVIHNVASGIIVKRQNCNGTSFDQPRTLEVGIEGFHNEPIKIAFDGTTGLKLMGTNELQSPRLSTGVLIEAWDGTGHPSHYETDGLVPATFKNK